MMQNKAMHAEHAIGRFEMGHLSRVPGDGRRYPSMNESWRTSMT